MFKCSILVNNDYAVRRKDAILAVRENREDAETRGNVEGGFIVIE
jgi:hypothetical protein